MEFQHSVDGARTAPANDQPRADFGRDLAHTLNNLLQVVNGNLELLALRLQDERLRGYVRNAQLAARQLTELAHDLNGDSAEGR